MQKLLVDTGVEEFEINGRRGLRFNPGDPNIYHRFFEAGDELAALDEKLGRDLAALGPDGQTGTPAVLALLAAYDRDVKALLGRVFGGGNDFDRILDGVNLAGTGANGRRVIENLVDALAPVLRAGAQRTLQSTADAAVAEADAARAERGAGADGDLA